MRNPSVSIDIRVSLGASAARKVVLAKLVSPFALQKKNRVPLSLQIMALGLHLSRNLLRLPSWELSVFYSGSSPDFHL